MQVGTVSEVVQSLQRAKLEAAEAGRPLGKALFFIGAGCSKTAGVPLAAEIAKELVCRLAQTYRLDSVSETPEDSFSALRKAGHFKNVATAPETDWYSVYDAMFQDHYKTPDHARSIFKRAIASAKGQINWAHLCLGELVSQGYCSTIVTTNFDLLVLEGLAAAGVIPVVSDGLESLGRIDGDPDYPQLIQLNGSIHSYRLRNKPEEIEAVAKDEIASACIRDLVRSTGTIVFIGYAGREKAIMGLLHKALTEFSEKEVYWCSYDANPDRIGAAAQDLMAGNPNARILLKQDADRFFFELCRDLGVGSPRFVSDPVGAIAKQASRVVKPTGRGTSADIRTEIDRLGELLEEVKSSLAVERGNHEVASVVDAAREQRLRGDDKKALDTLKDLVGGNGSPHAKVVDSAVIDAALSAFRLARKTENPDTVAESVRLARMVVELSKPDTADWALAQARLGDALDLASHGHDEGPTLNEAIEAFKKALRALDRSAEPDLWADIQDSLGISIWRKFEISGDRKLVKEAIKHFDLAQSVRTREDQPLLWGETQSNKANVLMSLGEKDRDANTLRKSAVMLESALEELSKSRVPEKWAVGSHNLASIYAITGEIQSDVGELMKSIALYEEIMADEELSRYPSDQAGLYRNLANSLCSLARLNRDEKAAIRAIELYDEAIEILKLLDMDMYLRQAQEGKVRAIALSNEIIGSTVKD